MFDILSLVLASAVVLSPQGETHATEPDGAAASPATAVVESAPPAAEQAPSPDHAAAGDEGHAAGTAAEGEGDHGGPAQVLMHHVMDQKEYRPFAVLGIDLAVPTKHMWFMVLVMAIVFVITQLALRSYRGGVPSGIGSAVEALVVFVRDEMAEKSIGHGDGAKYTPLLLSFFFFILVAALFGLLPFSATSTGNLSVTFALATISFIAQQYGGISKYGVIQHFKNLVPHGLPWPLLIVMIPIEILGMFTKPFALMIRLFANMLAGHMIITALLLLVPLSAAISQVFGIAMIPVSVGMALFIMCLEILVALIQAYVFTLFTAIFIGMYVHPAH